MIFRRQEHLDLVSYGGGGARRGRGKRRRGEEVRDSLGFLYLDWKDGCTTILGNAGRRTRLVEVEIMFSFLAI